MWWIGVVGVAAGVAAGAGTRRVVARLARESPVPAGWCEVACALGFAAVAVRNGLVPTLAPALLFVWWTIAAGVVDLRVRRLPNVLTLPGAVAIVGFATATGQWRTAVVGGLMLSGLYLLVHLTAPAAMGAGDVKLALGLGAAAGLGGAQTWLAAAALAPVLTAVVGVLRGRADGMIAHGPSMCAATALAMWPV
ncbi:prepilin peptidase [Rhodococcus sp. TAF43]|jgi:leader peptidase (prepilin peptidase) / N-methyltransferase|uniref:prepilin peptidase n=1 Tax=unclassified Rhodococcus (in: high G+C Gram-positive bacteria) TaxID=192944 RepID=UPI0015821235|nr:A24 family peptidase [Rhodococcus sp. W8901]QKT11388.1 prepilin peptidase [Rhodococcus sp. W8901]